MILHLLFQSRTFSSIYSSVLSFSFPLFFSSCTYAVQWAYGIPMCLSIRLSIRSQLENTSSRICLDGFSWYLDTMIIRWGTIRVFRNLGSKVIWGHCSNTSTLKKRLRLHNSIDFDETWVKRSLARGSFGVFRKFWPEVILGSFRVIRVTVERSHFKQPSTIKLTMSMCSSRSNIKKCSWWPLHPTCG